MARRDQDTEDYLNLGNDRRVDEFALGQSEPDCEYPSKEGERSIYILPMVTAFVLIGGVIIVFFMMRAWDRTPIQDIDRQEVRVIEPDAAPRSEPITKKSTPVTTPAISTPAPTNSETVKSVPINNEGAARSISTMLPELMPAIGMVVVRTETGISSGSGFVIRSDGTFITNYHVINGAVEIAIKLNNSDKINTAFILKIDEERDIAILRFKESGPFPVLKMEDTQEPGLGEEVIVLGYPLGTKLGLDLTVSTGIVSSLRNYPDLKLIQTNAAINHGNSGGPLINRRTGNVIGIVTAKMRDSDAIGFAINIKELIKML